MGRTRFMLVWGVLVGGAGTAVVASVMVAIIGDVPRGDWLRNLATALPVFMIGGAAWGLSTWHVRVMAEKAREGTPGCDKGGP